MRGVISTQQQYPSHHLPQQRGHHCHSESPAWVLNFPLCPSPFISSHFAPEFAAQPLSYVRVPRSIAGDKDLGTHNFLGVWSQEEGCERSRIRQETELSKDAVSVGLQHHPDPLGNSGASIPPGLVHLEAGKPASCTVLLPSCQLLSGYRQFPFTKGDAPEVGAAKSH